MIDDGSDDATPQILAELAHPDLVVLRRDPPRAREGKAAALNHAYRELDALLGDVDRDDGDRRHRRRRRATARRRAALRRRALRRLRRSAACSRSCASTTAGGCSPGCRTSSSPSTAHLFQAGRDGWGTAGMGGNGQFNRLRALDELADDDGPWRDRLTEDQDLGLRLIAAGWKGRQELRAVVEQQGLTTLRPLLRQRTRWSQGNLQAIGLTGEVLARAARPLPAHRAARLPADAALAGDRRRRRSSSRSLSRSPARRRSGTAARAGSCCSSTCSPSAGRSSAASPPAPAEVRSAGSAASSSRTSTRSTPGCSGRCSSARHCASSPSAATGSRPSARRSNRLGAHA